MYISFACEIFPRQNKVCLRGPPLCERALLALEKSRELRILAPRKSGRPGHGLRSITSGSHPRSRSSSSTNKKPNPVRSLASLTPSEDQVCGVMSELPPLPRVIAGHNAAGLGTIQQVDLITPEVSTHTHHPRGIPVTSVVNAWPVPSLRSSSPARRPGRYGRRRPCRRRTTMMSRFSVCAWSGRLGSADQVGRTDGATRPVTGDLGIVAPGATYCGVTDLAPGATASWVRTSLLYRRIQ